MKLFSKRKKRILLFISLVLALCSGICLLRISYLSHFLDAQNEAQRWKGENEMSFSQLSAFAPADGKLTLNDVYSFRTAMSEALKSASVESENTLFVDAWSAEGQGSVAGEHGKGTASIIAVGGEFFSFHPLKLLNGCYFTESSYSPDLVLLDEELAWLLFGGNDLQGMTMTIEGKEFTVSGVIEREQDFSGKAAYSYGMGLYMSYDAYTAIFGEGISTYEVVMPEPVDGFAYNTLCEKLTLKGGITLENTDRFSYTNLFRMLTGFGKRSMQQYAVALPYWENAARCVEDHCALLLALQIIFAIMPLTMAVMAVARSIKYAKYELEEDFWPKFKEKTAEAIRVRQRKNWEKRHKST